MKTLNSFIREILKEAAPVRRRPPAASAETADAPEDTQAQVKLNNLLAYQKEVLDWVNSNIIEISMAADNVVDPITGYDSSTALCKFLAEAKEIDSRGAEYGPDENLKNWATHFVALIMNSATGAELANGWIKAIPALERLGKLTVRYAEDRIQQQKIKESFNSRLLQESYVSSELKAILSEFLERRVLANEIDEFVAPDLRQLIKKNAQSVDELSSFGQNVTHQKFANKTFEDYAKREIVKEVKSLDLVDLGDLGEEIARDLAILGVKKSPGAASHTIEDLINAPDGLIYDVRTELARSLIGRNIKQLEQSIGNSIPVEIKSPDVVSAVKGAERSAKILAKKSGKGASGSMGPDIAGSAVGWVASAGAEMAKKALGALAGVVGFTILGGELYDLAIDHSPDPDVREAVSNLRTHQENSVILDVFFEMRDVKDVNFTTFIQRLYAVKDDVTTFSADEAAIQEFIDIIKTF